MTITMITIRPTIPTPVPSASAGIDNISPDSPVYLFGNAASRFADDLPWEWTGSVGLTLGRTVMTVRGDRRFGGITIGGILVIVGIVVALVWSILLGAIIAVVGLVAFGGFARGKWY
jgi:hypothetical protein